MCLVIAEVQNTWRRLLTKFSAPFAGFLMVYPLLNIREQQESGGVFGLRNLNGCVQGFSWYCILADALRYLVRALLHALL